LRKQLFLNFGVTTGAIEYYADNVLIEKATIPEF
jgi:hypothetical protein